MCKIPVPERVVFNRLELAFERKQIPGFVGNNKLEKVDGVAGVPGYAP